MRRLTPKQLPEQLERSLQRCYLLCGADPFLQQESQRLIRQAALAQGFSLCPTLVLDGKVDWRNLEQHFQALPLFAQHRLLPLILNTAAPNPQLSQQLTQLPSLLDQQMLLLFSLPQLKKKQEQTAWFTRLAQIPATYVNCSPPPPEQWPNWIQSQAGAYGLTIEAAAIEQLCSYYEGNLLAAAQLLEQLAILYPDGQLTLERLHNSLQDRAQFTAQHWINALLSGQTSRAVHSLQQLQAAASEPLLLLRILQNELLLLLKLQQRALTTPDHRLFEGETVWQNHRQLLNQARQRLSVSKLRQMLHQLTAVELQLKTGALAVNNLTIWQNLRLLTFLGCNVPVPTALLVP
ncbi:MAG: DNA polymerase III subunit delta [Candidatus Symbiodolus clandestinus]